VLVLSAAIYFIALGLSGVKFKQLMRR